MPEVENEAAIRALVRQSVQAYAAGFHDRHQSELNNPNGTLNMKIHNVFIAALGPEIQYYTALVRSLDSSLGNMLETLAVNIASLFFEVHRNVEGPLTVEQTRGIAELLEQYKRRQKKASVADYQFLRSGEVRVGETATKRHDSDYYLIKHETSEHFLIELKIGGDLDNKKARAEKEAVLEQFAILSNVLPPTAPVKMGFGEQRSREPA